MLGEKIGELQGKATNKALPAVNGAPRFETTAETSGTLAGVAVQAYATYQSDIQADGTLLGECPNSGVIMTQQGEVATFRANGSGKFTETGGADFRGAAYFRTSGSQLATLNGVCVIWHWDVDAEGNAKWDLWEWL